MIREWVLVVGPHRTGTSVLAGVLHHLGVNMGFALMGGDKANARGYYEDWAGYFLHRAMIGPWTHPDPEAHCDAYLQKIYDDYFAFRDRDAHTHDKVLGLKDPRLCFLLDRALLCLIFEPLF